MRVIIALVIAALIGLSGITVLAQGGAAPSQENPRVVKEKAIAIDCIAKMELSKEQKDKAAVAVRDLDWAGDTAAAWERCYTELAKILTPAELAIFKAEVATAKKPMQ
jgi:hypothetical protein